MWMQRLLFVVSLSAFAVSGANAQAPPAPATPPAATALPAQGGAVECTPTEAQPHRGGISPGGGVTGQGSESLGDKLAKSDGVLCPPSNVDPEMQAPAPDVGTMPVLPPPGSPGGDETVRPK
jgi:hypothetical protein